MFSQRITTYCASTSAILKCSLNNKDKTMSFKIAFQGDTSVMVLISLCFGVKFLCCLRPMYVFIFS